MGKIVDFTDAEKNARVRDLETERKNFEQEHNGVSKDELEKAMDLISKATGKEHYIGTKKSPQSKVRFSQFIQGNWLYLREQKYFTSEEKVFLVDIQCNVSMGSNAIVDDIKSKTPFALTIVSIAEMLVTSRAKVSRVVNSLIKKGVLAKSISGDVSQGHYAKDYVLFVNPHIVYAGDKEKIPEHLKLQFNNVMKKNEVLKKIPNKLF